MPNREPNQESNPPPPGQPGLETLEQLVRENLELSREIVEHTRKTRKYILFAQVLGVVKVVLIVGPIIIALIYLPPLLSQWFGAYTELLGSGTGQTILEGNSFINTLFDQNRSR
ncbi:MAG: hypothetical protein HYW81_02455 [Parcubacteria group bacterium]|nr:hypothetical protein [Parcubacteria group bacterium]